MLRRALLVTLLASLAALPACHGGTPAAEPPPAPRAHPSAPPPAATAAPSAGEASRAPSCPTYAGAAPARGAARQLVDGRHNGRVDRVAFSPSGRALASASSDRSVRVWDVAHGGALRVFPRLEPYGLASWDGEDRLVVTRGAWPLVMDVAHDRPVASLSDAANSSAFLPAPIGSGARWIATSYRKVVFYGEDAKELSRFHLSKKEGKDDKPVGGHVERVVLSADGAHVAGVYGRSEVAVRDTRKDAPERVMSVPGVDYVEQVALSPDGARAVAAGMKGSWSYMLAGATDGKRPLAPLPWPASVGLRMADGTNNGGGPPVTALAVSARRAAVATTAGVFVWDLETRALAWSRPVPPELAAPQAHEDSASAVAFSPDGATVAFGTSAGRVLVHDAASGRFLRELGTKVRWPTDLAVTPTGELLVVATDWGTRRSQVTTWSLGEARVKATRDAGPFAALQPSEAGFAAVGVDLSGPCGGYALRPEGIPGARRELCVPGTNPFDAANTRLAAKKPVALISIGSNPRAVLDLLTGALVRLERTDTPAGLLQSATLSSDGAWVAGFTTAKLFVWSATTGKITVERPLTGVPSAIALADDAKALALATPIFGSPNTTLEVLALPGGKPLYGGALGGGVVTTLAFGASHRDLFAGGFGSGRGSVLVLRDGAVVASSADDADQPFRLVVDAARGVVATVSQDGAARVWDPKTAALRAKLVEFADGEWLAATPGGAYAGTPEVGERVGWVFDEPLERHGFEQFASYRAPARVAARLRGEDTASVEAPPRPPTVAVTSAPPPGAPFAGASAKVAVRVASATRVDVVRLFQEGRPVAERAVCAQSGEATFEVPLLGGENHLSVVAYDERGLASNEAGVDVSATRADLPRPDVWVVAVGVSRYRNLAPSMQLGAAHHDADAIAALFKGLAPGTFAHAHSVSLTNEAATAEAVSRALAELSAMKPNDVAVVFFAGHGAKPRASEDTRFLLGGIELEPSGRAFVPASLTRESLGWGDISKALAAAKGRVLVMADACHSGHVTQELVVPNDALAATLVREQRAGAIVFAASKGAQVSLEPGNARGLVLAPSARQAVRYDEAAPHGFFTGAVLAALASPATDRNGDGAIQASELIDAASRSVAIATAGAQTPWIARRELIGDFTIATVGR